MPKPMKDIAELPLAVCPLCDSDSLTIVKGNKGLLGKKPDTIKCQECAAAFRVDRDKSHVNFESIPTPYSFFGKHFEEWVDVDSAVHLAWLIRTGNSDSLFYLSGYSRYIWQLKLMLGDSMSLTDISGQKATTAIAFAVEIPEVAPETSREAKQQLAQLRQLQKRLRQVKREIGGEIKEIRAHYKAKVSQVGPSIFAGSKKTDQRRDVARQKRHLREEQDQSIAPYDQLRLGIDNILLELDEAKLEIQNWLEQN